MESDTAPLPRTARLDGRPMAVQLRWTTWSDVCELTGDLIRPDNPAGYAPEGALIDTCGEPGPNYIKVTIPAQVTSTGGVIDPQIALHGDWIRRDATGLIHVAPLYRRCPTCLRPSKVTETATPGLVRSAAGLTLTIDHAVRMLGCADEWHIRKPFAFDWSRPDASPSEQMREAVFTALGAASVAWSRLPEGIFDSTLAQEIGEALLDVIRTQQRTLTEAIRLTREYVDPASATSPTNCLLKAIPGWSWYDAWNAVDPAGLYAYLNPPDPEPGPDPVEGIDLVLVVPEECSSCTCGDRTGEIPDGFTARHRSDGPCYMQPHDDAFNAVWTAIKDWDIQRQSGVGYAGATGDDVCTVLEAMEAANVR